MNKLLKSALSLLMALMLVFSLGTSAFAETWYIDEGSIVIEATGETQTVSQGDTQKQDSAPTITAHENAVGSTAENTTSNTITINAGENATANVTIKDVHIDTSAGDSAAISVTGTGDTNISFTGDNSVKSADNHAGIEKNGDNKVTGTLTITGTSDNATLTATGGKKAAGIGGGIEQSGENITITGGKVTATGGRSAAGIGGGYNGEGSHIKITGGEVTAKVNEDDNAGAGIGGGKNKNGSDIEITGGKVTATGGYGAAGIGGGFQGNGDKITISGGEVNATGGVGNNSSAGAGIGGGNAGDGTNIRISGGTVTATGGSVASSKANGAAGIGGGGGKNGDAQNVTISGGTVKATGGYGAAGIGGGASNGTGNPGNCKNVTISGEANVTATAGGAYIVDGKTLVNVGTAIGTGGGPGDKTATPVKPDTTNLNTDKGKIELITPDAPEPPKPPQADDPDKSDDPTKPTEPTNPTKPSDNTSSKVDSSSSASSADTTPAVTPVPARYSVTKGDKQTWLSTGADALTFTLSDDNVIKVLIDGEEVTFELKNGEIVIPAEVLQTLESGEHEIEFIYSDGSCKAVFTIE